VRKIYLNKVIIKIIKYKESAYKKLNMFIQLSIISIY